MSNTTSQKIHPEKPYIYSQIEIHYNLNFVLHAIAKESKCIWVFYSSKWIKTIAVAEFNIGFSEVNITQTGNGGK